jgi:hypothetical protein
MGIPSDVPSYVLLGASPAFMLNDGYRWARRKASEAYGYVEDRIDDASTLISATRDDLLYQTGLSPTSHIPRTFSKFGLLPAEIRCQIWREALPGPRVIEIRNNSPQKPLNVEPAFRGITSTCRIPSLLHVCREAREEALKSYELSFAIGEMPSKVYIDFNRDIVFFGSRCDFYDIQRNQVYYSLCDPVLGLERIQRLALRSRGFSHMSRFHFEVFKGLEEIILVGERHFELGPEPQLRREQVGETLLILPNVSSNLDVLERKSQAWKDRCPDWQAPVLSKGIFVKGKGDRWYCEGRGRSKWGRA